MQYKVLVFWTLMGWAGAAFAAAAGEPGEFGFGVSVDGSGFFLNPTVTRVTVNKVLPSSPAADAGLRVGDELVEVDGRAIAGTKAKDLQPLFAKAAGETLHLTIKRMDGEITPVALVAVAKHER